MKKQLLCTLNIYCMLFPTHPYPAPMHLSCGGWERTPLEEGAEESGREGGRVGGIEEWGRRESGKKVEDGGKKTFGGM